MSKYIFTENDYNSEYGMITSIWGPALWHSLHTISFNFPIKPTKEEKKHYFTFFKNLKYVLPCKMCQNNLSKYLNKHPLTLKDFNNRESLSKWVYNLHESVNTLLNKKSNLSYEDVRERYEQFRARCIIDPDKKENKHEGCSEPLYGKAAQTIINIVPRNKRNKTFKIAPECKISKK
jgi:dsDNA-binding SOS-regulon protein